MTDLDFLRLPANALNGVLIPDGGAFPDVVALHPEPTYPCEEQSDSD